jgi:hypothetical protein
MNEDLKTLGILNGEHAPHHGIHQREYRRVAADAKRHGNDSDRRETGILPKAA